MTMKLVITDTDNLPVEINPAGVIIYRQDMETVQEEADTMLIQLVAYVRPKKHSLMQITQILLCCLFSFVTKNTNFTFSHNGFTHSWLYSVRHQCDC